MPKKETASKTPTIPETVIQEFAPMGKYRLRVVENNKTKERALDIREFVSGERFEGFTRRGIRISMKDRAQMDLLRDVLQRLLENPPA